MSSSKMLSISFAISSVSVSESLFVSVFGGTGFGLSVTTFSGSGDAFVVVHSIVSLATVGADWSGGGGVCDVQERSMKGRVRRSIFFIVFIVSHKYIFFR